MKRNRYAGNEQYLRDLLRDARIIKKMRQDDLAKKLHVPQSFVSKYESGERLLTLSETVAICYALNLSPVDLLKKYLRFIPAPEEMS